MDYVKAFLIESLIYALVQILIEKIGMTPGRIIVLLVVSGTILGAVEIRESFAKWAGTRAGVPLLGLGDTLWRGIKEAIGKDGILEIFKGGLTASSTGICGVLVFGYLASLVFKPKMKQGVICPDIRTAGNGELPSDDYSPQPCFRLLLCS